MLLLLLLRAGRLLAACWLVIQERRCVSGRVGAASMRKSSVGGRKGGARGEQSIKKEAEGREERGWGPQPGALLAVTF